MCCNSVFDTLKQTYIFSSPIEFHRLCNDNRLIGVVLIKTSDVPNLTPVMTDVSGIRVLVRSSHYRYLLGTNVYTKIISRVDYKTKSYVVNRLDCRLIIVHRYKAEFMFGPARPWLRVANFF